MKPWVALAIAGLAATPVSAQEATPQDPAGYVSGFGGAAWTDGNSTGGVVFEGGVRVAPHLMAFTNVGRFADLRAWVADVGYRYSRIAADTALSATALNANVITFGVGYRF